MHRLGLIGACLACLLACSASSTSQSEPKNDAGGDTGSTGSGDVGDFVPGNVLNATPLQGRPDPLTLDAVAAVYTQHNDIARTGLNPFETTLDTTNVSKETFGLLFSHSVVGQMYAQPLFAPAVAIPGQGVHDVVLVATEHNDVYAFDAIDAISDVPLWHVHLADPIPTADLLSGGLYCSDLSPEVGITATPFINAEAGVVYLETKDRAADGTFGHHLHALDLATGIDLPNSPVEITSGIPGTGDGSVDGVLSFDPLKENARAGILLSHGVLWIAYAGHCDATPFHGWVFAYDAATLKQLGAYADTPNTFAGGIWMGGQGMAADLDGDPYFLSGNGAYAEGIDSTAGELGDSFVKLHLTYLGITVKDWFTPFNQETLSDNDLDLGSTGIMLIPGTRWILGAGKQGKLYVVDRDDMGGYNTDNDDQIVQSFQATAPLPEWVHPLYGSPVFWNEHIYLWGVGDDLKAYRLNGSGFDVTPEARSTIGVQPAMPGGILSISSNGKAAGSAVLWASHAKSDAGRTTAAGVLRAFDAADISHELWNSDQIPTRDGVGTFAKFTPPTVVSGHVYLATFANKLQVYGLLPH